MTSSKSMVKAPGHELDLAGLPRRGRHVRILMNEPDVPEPVAGEDRRTERADGAEKSAGKRYIGHPADFNGVHGSNQGVSRVRPG